MSKLLEVSDSFGVAELVKVLELAKGEDELVAQNKTGVRLEDTSKLFEILESVGVAELVDQLVLAKGEEELVDQNKTCFGLEKVVRGVVEELELDSNEEEVCQNNNGCLVDTEALVPKLSAVD